MAVLTGAIAVQFVLNDEVIREHRMPYEAGVFTEDFRFEWGVDRPGNFVFRIIGLADRTPIAHLYATLDGRRRHAFVAAGEILHFSGKAGDPLFEEFHIQEDDTQ